MALNPACKADSGGCAGENLRNAGARQGQRSTENAEKTGPFTESWGYDETLNTGDYLSIHTFLVLFA
jgi:hypothetical protein